MFNIKYAVHSLHHSKVKPECLREFDEFRATWEWRASLFLCSYYNTQKDIWWKLHLRPWSPRLQRILLHSHLSHHPPCLASHFQLAPHPKAEILPQDLLPFEIQIPGAISPAQKLPYGEQTSFSLAVLSLCNWTYSNSAAYLMFGVLLECSSDAYKYCTEM